MIFQSVYSLVTGITSEGSTIEVNNMLLFFDYLLGTTTGRFSVNLLITPWDGYCSNFPNEDSDLERLCHLPEVPMGSKSVAESGVQLSSLRLLSPCSYLLCLKRGADSEPQVFRGKRKWYLMGPWKVNTFLRPPSPYVKHWLCADTMCRARSVLSYKEERKFGEGKLRAKNILSSIKYFTRSTNKVGNWTTLCIYIYLCVYVYMLRLA